MKRLARLILAASAAVTLSAQNQPKATFEVASVKPNPESGPPATSQSIPKTRQGISRCATSR